MSTAFAFQRSSDAQVDSVSFAERLSMPHLEGAPFFVRALMPYLVARPSLTVL